MSSDPNERRVLLVQGDVIVSNERDVLLTTILGSCVAACLRDPVAGIGGMNHFLLPCTKNGGVDARAQSYGVHLMELLVNDLMQRGARRERLEAKLFGGARLMDGLADIGAQNSEFAERFVRTEGIRLIGASLRGTQGRRVQFWPVSGRARQAYIGALDEARGRTDAAVFAPASAGDLELF